MTKLKIKQIRKRNIGYILAAIILSVTAGVFLMTLVYMLPVKKMKQNVESTVQLYRTDVYSSNLWAPGFYSSALDIYTDAMMQYIAVFQKDGSALEAAMKNSFVYYYEGEGDPLIATLFYDGMDEDAVMDENVVIRDYNRYWHGYLLYMKPLLSVTNMAGMRMLNMVFQLFLMNIVFFTVYRKGGLKSFLPFWIAVMCLNPVSTMLCFQYSSMFYVTMISAFFLVVSERFRSEDVWKVFLWTGIATAFFDLLTYPLVGLGINLLLLLTLWEEKDFKRKIQSLFYTCIVWGIGFAGMWCGKWLVASLVTGQNVFADAFGAAWNRISGAAINAAGADSATIAEVFRINVIQYIHMPEKLALIVAFSAIIYLCVFRNYRIRICRKEILPYVFVGILPFIWYCVLRNHSAVHFWFTCRNLSITIMAAVCILFCIVIKKEENSEI